MKSPQSIDAGKARNRTTDPLAGVLRGSNAGLSWLPLGDCGASPQLTGVMTPTMLFNSTGSVAYVAFGGDVPATPTSGASGMPVLAGQVAYYNSGPNTHVLASTSGVFAYSAEPEVSQMATPPSTLENPQEDMTAIPANERN